MIDKYTSIDDLSWYFVCYSDGESVCSIEMAFDEDVFVPSLVSKQIQNTNNLKYCCLVNWKKITSQQISTESKVNFEKYLKDRV